jgi:transcriptional regulator with XRE-family HTH domain
MMIFGVLLVKNLRAMREEKGVSQQKVADAIGSNQQSIHRYENGDYEPDIQTLTLLADYFETSIDYLVGRTDIRKKIERVEEYALNHGEAKLIDKIREFSPEYRKCLSVMLDALTEVADNTNK